MPDIFLLLLLGLNCKTKDFLTNYSVAEDQIAIMSVDQM